MDETMHNAIVALQKADSKYLEPDAIAVEQELLHYLTEHPGTELSLETVTDLIYAVRDNRAYGSPAHNEHLEEMLLTVLDMIESM